MKTPKISPDFKRKLAQLAAKDPKKINEANREKWIQAQAAYNKAHREYVDYDYEGEHKKWYAEVRQLQASCSSIYELDALLELMR